jgi:hypothetical protein
MNQSIRIAASQLDPNKKKSEPCKKHDGLFFLRGALGGRASFTLRYTIEELPYHSRAVKS